jgi:hypothetical protein
LASCTGGPDGLGGKPSFPLSRQARRGTLIDEALVRLLVAEDQSRCRKLRGCQTMGR